MPDRNPEADRYEKLLFPIAAGILIVAVLIGIGFFLVPDNNGLFTNLVSEAISIGITVAILNKLAEHREEQRYKRDLIWKMGSRVNSDAVRAVEELRRHGWLTDEITVGHDFSKRNLTEIDFQETNLNGVNFMQTKLDQSIFTKADLRNAKLSLASMLGCNLFNTQLNQAEIVKTNLKTADLRFSDLQGANLNMSVCFKAKLSYANLAGTSIYQVDFRGAHLGHTNLQAAKEIHSAIFDEQTTLPDGTMWTPETGLTRFTDPDHPQFWRSDNPASPAYRVKTTSREQR